MSCPFLSTRLKLSEGTRQDAKSLVKKYGQAQGPTPGPTQGQGQGQGQDMVWSWSGQVRSGQVRL